MSTFPPEIWAEIFALACTDGGPTGCALSSVSHYFRMIVLPLQLYNVALVNPTQMLSFAAVLLKRGPDLRRVKHLYLSMDSRNTGHTDFGHTSTRAPGFMKRVTMILAMLAPDLTTLTIMLPEMGRPSRTMFSIHFPKLKDLTVHGQLVNPSSATASSEEVANLKPCFPLLTHLHILTSPDSFPLFTTHAPALTHLGLSMVTTLHESTFEDLILALHGYDEQNSSEPAKRSRASIAPTVQKIVIQPHWGTNRFGRGSAIWELKKRDPLGRLVVRWPKYQSGQSLPTQELSEREMWMERILGGCGFWNEDKQGSNSGKDDLCKLMDALGT